MGCLSSNEVVLVQYRTFQTRVVTVQNQNVTIQLPDPKLFEFDKDFLKDCNNIEKVTYSDFIYEGQMKNGKRNGKGRMTWTDDNGKGDVYEGEFKDGYRHGKGIYKYYNSGSIYNGQWNMGVQEGWGVVKYKDSFYEGEWKNDKRNGKGKYTWIDGDWKGDVYEGEFKDGYRHGKGVYKYNNGNVYDGEWNQGLKHGFGIWKLYSGIYEGEFKNDKREGKGKMTYKDEWDGVYEGEWKNDKKHGKGICTKYGERYIQEWDEGKLYVKSRKKAGKLIDLNGNVFGVVRSNGYLFDEYNSDYKGDVYSNGEWYENNQYKGKILFEEGEILDEHYNKIGRFEED